MTMEAGVHPLSTHGASPQEATTVRGFFISSSTNQVVSQLAKLPSITMYSFSHPNLLDDLLGS